MLLFAVLALALSHVFPALGGPTEVRSGDRLCYALTGAKVIAAPGRVIDPGVVRRHVRINEGRWRRR
jgi:hypothetical protein